MKIEEVFLRRSEKSQLQFRKNEHKIRWKWSSKDQIHCS